MLTALLSVVLLSSPLSAQPPADGPGLGISLGLYDFDDPLEAAEFGLDWQFRPKRFGLVPHVGVAGTEDETIYAYAGLRRDFRFGGQFRVTPSFAFVLWDAGDGKDLGNALEFRSGLALYRDLGRGSRIGLGFYHLSNGSLSSTNPGANELLLHILLPSRRGEG